VVAQARRLDPRDRRSGRRWERLADGATVVQPLAPAQWAPLSGMLRDRFGVTWVVDVAAPYDAG
jgi:PhnB protein